MRRRRFSRGPAKPKDWCWVTTIIGANIAENTYEADLVTSGTWEANVNNFERATLHAVRGWVCWTQSAASTNADICGLFLAIFKQGLTEVGQFDPRLAADYDTHDVLWTCGAQLGESGNGPNPYLTDSYMLDIKVKRKLDSATKLTFVASMDADTATPSGQLTGVIRCLINRA